MGRRRRTAALLGSLELVQRNALLLLVLAVLSFLSFTALPVTWLDLPSRSKVFVSEDGVDIDGRSLVLSEPGISVLHSIPFRQGRFSIELAVKPRNLHADGPARIVAFSTDTKSQNWLVGQEAAALEIRHRGRKVRFSDVLATDELQHFLVVFGPDDVTLYGAGEPIGQRRWQGSMRPWDENARFTIGNEVTGDRPWVGVVARFRLYDRRLGAEDAAALSRRSNDNEGGYVEEPTVSLVASSSGRLALHTSIDVQDLKTYRWPLVNKVDKVLSVGYQISETNLLDVFQNIVLGLPFGFLIFAWLGKTGTFRIFVLAISVQFLLSFLVELSQLSSNYRVASPMDVFFNVLGAALGGAMWRFAVRPGLK